MWLGPQSSRQGTNVGLAAAGCALHLGVRESLGWLAVGYRPACQLHAPRAVVLLTCQWGTL